MKMIKTLVTTVVTLGLLALAVPAVHAQPYYQPIRAINSSATTATNVIFGTATNGIWPNNFVGGLLVTNFTKVDVSGVKLLSIQVTAASEVSVGAWAGQNVKLKIYRNVQGGNPTNAVGTGLNYDTFDTITLPVTSSTTGPWTVVSNYTDSATSPTPLAGVTTLYLGYLDASSVTNGVHLTNYSVYISGK